ncbi:hypothetical protein [Streptomyces sp. SID13031]|uniref:hypothetical protein n=1 Tax=Streptomyces sp. SID13031 TaxID=2706046 RepID=UPI0013C8F7F7|nr:hypothetical protein [Streptomyces sp. SID13031]NEA37497.1 hypothetical protein [Streptomyces sp. SID13031]
MTLSTLYRSAAVAGLTSGAVLLVNTAKRAEVIPATAATQLLAPLAQVLALGLVVALFARTGRRAGAFGAVAFGLNFAAIALLVGVEFVLNLVFPHVDDATVDSLRAGPLGVALTVSSILFLVSTTVFAASLWRREGPPRPALLLYAVGAVPVSLRAAVPEAALQGGLLLLAVAVGWLSVWLWSSSREPLPA